ncbi:hypothetical protein HAZT_HAZT006696 [Hyalella azteca]|uniref:Uncharacterized protein n=1 Tax=Hyalella azteca TaxID=294128 RepID=A0A6A0H1U5_HYAAZ|nr:hypothetical protein HAZT_HAZT006696 [Hyalella azteca]
MCFAKKATLSSEEFDLWRRTHTRCKKNFEGKSGAMEKEAAVRLGTRLRALKAKSKVVTTTKAGKQVMSKFAGKGMLTDAVIDALSRFGTNIRKFASTGDVATVRAAIMATFSHSSSTDANPAIRSTLAAPLELTRGAGSGEPKHW